MASLDLELTLDRAPIEYPALVREAITAHRTDASSNCAALNDKYCWFLSKSHMFIWERSKASTVKTLIPTQLPLALSGLLQSTKCVVVYDGAKNVESSKSSSPGVLVVSPEGVLRHWQSIQKQNFAEAILEINNEVVLRVELVQSPSISQTSKFILTTTSGSVYFLKEDKTRNNGVLYAEKIAGKEQKNMRRRLSSIVFGGLSKDQPPLVSNSFQFLSESMELLVICVSPEVLTVYNIERNTEWSLKTNDFFLPIARNYLESDIQSTPLKPKATLIDASPFRNGLIILMSATHQEAQLISLYLVYLSSDWQFDAPLDSTWSCRVPIPNAAALFSKNDASIYSNLTLCVSKRSAESKKSERTDGIIIVNPFFVQAMYVPDDLENSNNWDLVLCKSISLPVNDHLIGTTVTKNYSYILLLDSGVSKIRLLPKGFSDGTTSIYSSNSAQSVTSNATISEDWGVLSDILSEMVATGLPKTKQLQSLHKAFEYFGEKDMVAASFELKVLNSINDSEVALAVEQFLYAIINFTDASNKTETELQAKKVLTSRIYLFLKHMGLYDRICDANIPNVQFPSSSDYRTGSIMLAEMSEKVAAAAAIWNWKNMNLQNSELLNSVLDTALKTVTEVIDAGLSDKDTLFGKIGLVHNIAKVAYIQLVSAIDKGKSLKIDMFHLVSELLISMKEGILASRRSKTAIPKIRNWWTIDALSDVYRKTCLKIIEELKGGVSTESEKSRLQAYVISLYDFYLGEIDNQPDGDCVLNDIIYSGRVSEGLALAEKHKDFGVLVKINLTSDKLTRQKAFNRLKKMYENDDFEMYLCQYLKNHGLNEILLEQKGERVDAYLDNFKELRFSREIANKQYAKAAFTLMGLADMETKSFKNFSNYLMKAYFCAKAAERGDDEVEEVLEFYRNRLPELKHRKAIPDEIIKAGYGDNTDVMMSTDEMLEWNMTLQPSDEMTIEGYVRAFHFLSDLLKLEKSDKLIERIENTWKMVIDSDEWVKVRSKDDVQTKSIFGKLCDYLAFSFPNEKGSGFPKWSVQDRLLIIPKNVDVCIGNIDKQKPWIKAHFKWLVEQLKQLQKLPNSEFYQPDSKYVGSFTSTALEQFAPIFSINEKKWENLFKKKCLEV